MLKKEEIKEVLLEAASTGADFVEAYFEDNSSTSVRVIGDKVEDITSRMLHGCALRLLRGVEEIYGYTNDVTKEGLMKLAVSLKTGFNSGVLVKDFEFKKDTTVKHTVFKSLDKDIKKACSTMIEMSKVMKEHDPRIIQAMSGYTGEVQKVTIANTDGTLVEDTRFIQRIMSQAISKDDKKTQMGSESFGGNFDFETLMKHDWVEHAKRVAAVAITMLSAREIPGGVYDVVIHNGFGGVIFHEACGHSLEATSVAKNMSVFSNKLGEKIASDVVTAIDDGTIPNEWGSENFDDEGNPQQRRVLIKDGVLQSYMIDKKNGRRMGKEATGSSRRQSYRYSPTSRMSNTYIANGESTFEEIIANTKYGLFAKSMGGGSVNPATGEFNFSVAEGYMIEDGKITYPVTGATLIGNGKDTLLKIDMVADNCSFGYGMCGSSSGSIPACVGQPTIRVKNMTVGGRG